MNKLKVLDLFSGIGGFSLGLERSGFFETALFCEQDDHAKMVLEKHWPETEISNDIKSLSFFGGEFDVVTGGFPCQDISFAGNRKGIEKGERSSLWKEMLRLIDEVGPKYAIIENVEHLRKNGLGVVLNDLAKIGYDAEWATFTAESVGYPHQRERLYIISYPGSQRFNEHFREKRHLQTNKKRKSEKVHTEGEKCEFEPIEVCEVLSKWTFEKLRSTLPCRKSAVSNVYRVVDGLLSKLDESRRKQRIKQLGNSIIPELAWVIGMAIAEKEKMIK